MQPKTPKRKSMKEVDTPKKAESPAVIKNGTPKLKTPKKENDTVANDSKKNGKAKKRSASLSIKTEGTPSPKNSKQEVSPSKKSKQEVSSPENKEVKTKPRRNRPKSKLQNHIKTALRTNDVSTLTITPENLKERIASMKSNDTISKSAKRKLAMYTKLYQIMTGEARPNKKGKPVKGGKVKSNENAEVKGSKKTKQNKKPAKVEVEEESDDEIDEEMSGDEEVTEENSDEDSEELEEASDDDELEEASDDDESEEEEVEEKKAGKQNKKPQPEVDSDLSDEDDDDDEEGNEESEESDDEPEVAKKPAKKEQKKPNQNAAKQGTKHVAFVGSLPFSMKLDEVREFLGNYDGVVFVEVPPHEESGKHKGFAFVHFKDEKSYQNLLSQSGSLVVKDRKIIVKPRNQKSEPGQKKNTQHNKKAKKAT